MTRKTMSKWGRGLALATMSLAFAAFASAQGPEGAPGMGPHRPPMERAMGPGGDHGRWWDNPQISDKYKITDTQRKAMDDIYQQHRLTLVDLHGTLEKAELALEPLIQADEPDEGKIVSQIDRVAQARAELEKANARMLLGLRKELTPEQWKQLQADRAARRAGEHGGPMGPRMQHRRLGGPGTEAPATPGGPPPAGGGSGLEGPSEDE